LHWVAARSRSELTSSCDPRRVLNNFSKSLIWSSEAPWLPISVGFRPVSTSWRNLLYRWFVGLGIDEPVWVPTVFTKNRERLLEAEVAHKFLAQLLNHKEVRNLLSDEHFSVDGTAGCGVGVDE
jgi:hypothetical protein